MLVGGDQSQKYLKNILKLILLLICITVGFIFGYRHVHGLNLPPEIFPVNTDIEINEGMTIQEIAEVFESRNIVKSSLFLNTLLKLKFNGGFAQAGVYRFFEPKTTIEIANAITRGENISPLVALTFPEGFQTKDFAQYLGNSFELHENIAQYEGYLFPETYFFQKSDSIKDILTVMQKTFDEKMSVYQTEISNSPFSLKEVIILASILEREANNETSMKMISGILQNRLRDGIPLQVDATFDYFLGKESAELTQADLQTDSPFNTYKNAGLPPSPISNPGIMAIEAVLRPTQTKYYYYLTDAEGVFHYARTFEEHKKNKEKYLR